jgi:hypothetical protein
MSEKKSLNIAMLIIHIGLADMILIEILTNSVVIAAIVLIYVIFLIAGYLNLFLDEDDPRRKIHGYKNMWWR